MDLLEAFRRRLERDVTQAQEFFHIRPVRNAQGLIHRLHVEMSGVVGDWSHARMDYWLLVTLDGYPFACPKVWVEKPLEQRICHLNIWRPQKPMNLPEVCLSASLRFQDDWEAKRIPSEERNITGLLRQVAFTLNNENTHSKARE